ncbi:MAG TPA: hypothetical protein VL866_05200 [Pyrinomonadaceae bacterium]|nr:hypothetical protein [Pyrinomonadaceae bacterium]
MSSKVQIDELRLRVPWSQRHQAKRLGQAVAARLAERPVSIGQQSRTVPSLNTVVSSRSDDSVEQMANEIARSIRSRL